MPAQKNYIGELYGQDCGLYTVRLESPIHLLTVVNDGSNWRFDLAQAGVWEFGEYDSMVVIE